MTNEMYGFRVGQTVYAQCDFQVNDDEVKAGEALCITAIRPKAYVYPPARRKELNDYLGRPAFDGKEYCLNLVRADQNENRKQIRVNFCCISKKNPFNFFTVPEAQT